ncbi:hypothetical protein RHS04_06927 [Rhizoctonia solani]|uniref:MYND-type domain-containing protein n=1 Tax=Rhizoctonia solani TaxID=456999 RepID=A0A8H7LI22_9AGAM|nr:hypothetical protein RHS04_06927 [Rhizoctonia solani]
MERSCHHCEADEPGLSVCSGCHNAWYCSSGCQKADWKFHRLRCLHPSKLTSADRLAILVYDNFLPNHLDVQLCQDYGFAQAQFEQSESRLLSLFQGIITYGNIDSRKIHQQRLAGTLIDYIKNYYENIPAYARGGYYPWFLKNQHLLAPPKFPDMSTATLSNSEFIQRAWCFAGGLVTDDLDSIQSHTKDWPEEKLCAFRFVQLLLHTRFQLSPDLPEWVHFGFCGCSLPNEEKNLWNSYIELIHKVLFEHFYTAYDGSSLPDLFSANGLEITNPFVLDVLSGTPHMTKSVWSLKQFALGDYARLKPSLIVDYGFMNCGGEEDLVYSLKEVYHRILTAPGANPLKLHEACLQGKLF